VVGYLGDGINDAPPLHSADVGISVDTAVDVAKDAADMILLKHDLSVLCRGVVEGRRTFVNIMKYIMMGTSSNFGNMFSMAGAALFLPFLPMLPIQILLNNLLYDFSEIAIPLDRVDAEELRAPHAWDMQFIRNFMLVLGPVSSIFDFITFYVMQTVLRANEALFQTGWFIESLATQVLVIFVIRTRGNPIKSRPHPWLVASSLAVVALAAALVLRKNWIKTV
jgi:Mg2+-importing ATPase